MTVQKHLFKGQTNLRSRGETYSNYKSHTTVKYLVGISPHGQIMFLSNAFGGRASDKLIVEKSGFMNYLLPGDEIMVDRGFTIDYGRPWFYYR